MGCGASKGMIEGAMDDALPAHPHELPKESSPIPTETEPQAEVEPIAPVDTKDTKTKKPKKEKRGDKKPKHAAQPPVSETRGEPAPIAAEPAIEPSIRASDVAPAREPPVPQADEPVAAAEPVSDVESEPEPVAIAVPVSEPVEQPPAPEPVEPVAVTEPEAPAEVEPTTEPEPAEEVTEPTEEPAEEPVEGPTEEEPVEAPAAEVPMPEEPVPEEAVPEPEEPSTQPPPIDTTRDVDADTTPAYTSPVAQDRPSTLTSEPDITPEIKPEPVTAPEEVELAQWEKERVAMAAAEADSAEREDARREQALTADFEDTETSRAKREAARDDDSERLKAEDRAALDNPTLTSVRVFLPGRPSTYFHVHLKEEDKTLMDLKLAVGRITGVLYSKQVIYTPEFRPVESDQAVLEDIPGWATSPALRLFADSIAPVSAPVEYTEPVETPDVAGRQWMEQFRLAWDGIDGTGSVTHMDSEQELRRLTRDIEAAAVDAVQDVTKGFVAPCTPPIPVTGTVYHVNGLMVRRAGDWVVRGVNGGVGDVAFHMAGNEQRMVDVVRALKVKGLAVPPTVTVDFCGNRYLVSPFPEVTAADLAYGTDNEALTVVTHQPDAAEVAAALGAGLNLATHTVVQGLPAAYDLNNIDNQAAITPDGRVVHTCPLSPHTRLYRTTYGDFIPVNLAANLIPDARSLHDAAPGDADLVRLTSVLRPELTSQFSHNNRVEDGFVHFTSLEPRVCDSCQKVIDGFEYMTDGAEYDLCLNCAPGLPQADIARLKRVTVPVAIRADYWKNESGDVRLDRPSVLTPLNPDNEWPRDAEVIEELSEAATATEEGMYELAVNATDDILTEFMVDLNTRRFVPLVPADLVAELHSRGLNVRCLGVIANQAEHAYTTEIAAREIVTRCAKVLLRDTMADKDPADVPTITATYLNLLVARGADPERAETVWAFISQLALQQFGYEVDSSVRDKIYVPGLVGRLGQLVGAQLDLAQTNFNAETPFTADDVQDIIPVLKREAAVESEALAVLDRALAVDQRGKRSRWHLPGGPEREEATAMLLDALALCEHQYGAEMVDLTAVDILLAIAGHYESRFCEAGRPENSRWNKCAGIPPNDLSGEAVATLNRAIGILETHEFPLPSQPAVALKLSAAKHALARLVAQEDPEYCLTHLDDAISHMEAVVGFQHPTVAALYLELALALQEAGRIDNAASNARRAFVGLVRTVGLDARVTKTTYQMLCQIETQNDSGLEHVPIEDMEAEIEALEIQG